MADDRGAVVLLTKGGRPRLLGAGVRASTAVSSFRGPSRSSGVGRGASELGSRPTLGRKGVIISRVRFFAYGFA